MGVFDRARAPTRRKPARSVADDARARLREKTKEIRDEIDDTSATQFILVGASLVGAFLLGRRARRPETRKGDLDTVAALLKQPYMRELGTPSPERGLRGVLARAKRAALGDDDAETRVRAMELTVKTENIAADLGVSDVEIMIKNEVASMGVMSDIAAMEAKLEASLNGSDWLLDQSVDETPGKFDGGGRFDGATVSPIAAFSSAGDGGTPLSDASFERTTSKLEI